MLDLSGGMIAPFPVASESDGAPGGGSGARDVRTWWEGRRAEYITAAPDGGDGVETVAMASPPCLRRLLAPPACAASHE